MLFCSSSVAHSSKATDPETSILAMAELDLLKKPEYIHVVLNHLPIFGTILGALALAISLILRSRAGQVTALIITQISVASPYPTFLTLESPHTSIPALTPPSHT